ncbi:MAG: hypothetical protein E7478_09815 [Ruminococcaceae bacterium]|nr:hypothetical protein [Oscillospiraceae bacterium]
MGLFGSKEKSRYIFIKDIAAIICGGDTAVLSCIEDMLSHPKKYFKRNADRYDDRGIDAEEIEDILEEGDEEEKAELFWLGMVDELIEGGYVAEVDYKCSAEELMYALQQLKSYSYIAQVCSGFMPDSSGTVASWCRQISDASKGTAGIGCIDIDSDSYPLFILSSSGGSDFGELLGRIGSIAQDNDFTITEP